MGTPEEARLAAVRAYGAAADSYDHPANAFWDRFGRRTVERQVTDVVFAVATKER